MSLFRRRRDADDATSEHEPSPHLDDDQYAGNEAGADADAAGSPGGTSSQSRAAELADPGLRGAGPWDLSEVEDPAEGGRADLGGMWIPGAPRLEVRIDGDRATGAVTAVTLVLGDGALQVLPFAAPRTESIWPEVRGEIKAGITADGGTVEEADGPFGTELRARVPFTDPQGRHSLQPARFLGVDGPRWFLRGVFSGRPAVDPDTGEELLSLFRRIVVVRGSTPMAPREPLPLHLPAASVPAAAEPEPANEEPQHADDLRPFERGPEITEIR